MPRTAVMIPKALEKTSQFALYAKETTTVPVVIAYDTTAKSRKNALWLERTAMTQTGPGRTCAGQRKVLPSKESIDIGAWVTLVAGFISAGSYVLSRQGLTVLTGLAHPRQAVDAEPMKYA